MSVDISVVILNYNQYEMTIEYVKNLKKQDWKNIRYHLVIIDNGSSNGGGRVLFDEFKDDENVTVLINKENEGFARGNNIGIKYSISELKANLIIVSNNDIVIEDNLFMKNLWNEYNDSKYAVMGPDIYSIGRQLHQSPIADNPYSYSELQRTIHKNKRKIILLKILKHTHSYELIRSLIKKCKSKPYNHSVDGVEDHIIRENVVLQGAFFVLTPQYYNVFPLGLFDKTFLYVEEHILSYLCTIKGLQTVYDSRFKVLHYDGYTAHKDKKDRCDKYIFELQETNKSYEIMMELICETENNMQQHKLKRW